MAQTIASVIESTKDESGLVAAQAKYRQYFIKLDKYFGKFQAECANDLFDWVIEVTEVDIIEPATTPAATPSTQPKK